MSAHSAAPARDTFEAGLHRYLDTAAGVPFARVAVWYLAGSDPRQLLMLLEIFAAENVGGVVPAALLEDLRAALVEDARRGFE